MREIKFRAYDPETGCMTHGATLKYACEQAYEKGHRQADFEWDDNIVMLQYTGLKDKKGTEIYEGDVVVAIELGIDENFLKTEEVWSKRTGEVYWDELIAGWGIRSEAFERGCEPLTHMDEFEVIGNIYQNKELLTKTQIQ